MKLAVGYEPALTPGGYLISTKPCVAGKSGIMAPSFGLPVYWV